MSFVALCFTTRNQSTNPQMQVQRQLTSQHKDALDKFLKDPRAISIKQPYASAILDAKCGKTCENRTWQVKVKIQSSVCDSILR